MALLTLPRVVYSAVLFCSIPPQHRNLKKIS
jgi:hypothetical protein